MAMQRDLQELIISPAQVESLSQVPVAWLYRPQPARRFKDRLRQFSAFWDLLRLLVTLDLFLRFLTFWTGGSLLTLVGRIWIPGLQATWGTWLVEWGILAAIAALGQAYWIFRSRRMPLLLNLLGEVDRYNRIIQAIHVNDQLVEAGNPEVKLAQRAEVIEALKLTRADLIRALKTERILRQNEDLIEQQSEFFGDNLAALTALQVSEQASEQGRILETALQIALQVRSQIRRLQEREANQAPSRDPDTIREDRQDTDGNSDWQ
ncbi:hypothetical protein NW870_04175 [Synechococcus sp. R50.1]|jgi:hypothetical protein|uniref:hypothetical protein n=1 Tax=Synechococcus sp. R50.1 TaxID=2969649 RepID=UPI0039C2A9A4